MWGTGRILFLMEVEKLVVAVEKLIREVEKLAPSTLAQWFGAAGTIAAVAVALFKDEILAWGRRPRFNVTCSKEIPWTVRTLTIVKDDQGAILWTGHCYWVRIKIENTGRARAEKVEVSAQKLAKRGPDNKFTELPTILPLDLKWSNIGIPILDGISPKMSRFCDIVSLCHPANPYQRRPANTPAKTTIGQLQLEVDPITDEAHLMPTGTYQLTLRIAAANAEPVDKILEFTHTGAWLQNDNDMRRDCLGVSLE